MGKPENTIGALKYPGKDPKNAQKVVMALPNNGEFIKEAAPMIETLKKVTNGMNPPVPMAVGPMNLLGAIKSAASLIKKVKNEDEGEGDPCAIENRANLTPEQRAECERLDAIGGEILELTSEPTHNTTISDEWTDYSANTIDSQAYQDAISNVSSQLAANATFIAAVGAEAAGSINEAPANTFTNTFMTSLAGNTTFVTALVSNTTFQNEMTSNTTFLTALKAALNALP